MRQWKAAFTGSCPVVQVSTLQVQEADILGGGTWRKAWVQSEAQVVDWVVGLYHNNQERWCAIIPPQLCHSLSPSCLCPFNPSQGFLPTAMCCWAPHPNVGCRVRWAPATLKSPSRQWGAAGREAAAGCCAGWGFGHSLQRNILSLGPSITPGLSGLLKKKFLFLRKAHWFSAIESMLGFFLFAFSYQFLTLKKYLSLTPSLASFLQQMVHGVSNALP